MGIGFVLIVWTILLAALATPVMLVFLLVANRTGGRARLKRVFRWAVITAPLAFGYVVVWFVAYALWCSEVRGVDPGIGDSSNVPLGDGFNLTFMDVSDEASIPERHKMDGVSLTDGITQVGQSGRYVYGLTGTDRAFILETRSGTLRQLPRQALPTALHEVGVADATVKPVFRFYMARRWGWQDLVAVAALLGPLLLYGWRSVRRAWTGVAPQVS